MSEDSITFDFPSMNAIASHIEALKEGFVRGSSKPKTLEEIEIIKQNPEKYIISLNEQKTGYRDWPDGSQARYVPFETFWLCEGAVFIGDISFRHELNENTVLHGGHVGYGVRPSMQGKGYGTLMLEMVRRRAAERGMKRLLLSCAPDNIASQKVILNNGGVYQDTLGNPCGCGPTERYWVPTT